HSLSGTRKKSVLTLLSLSLFFLANLRPHIPSEYQLNTSSAMCKIRFIGQFHYRELLSVARFVPKRGRPFKHPSGKMLSAVLMRLKTGLPLRTIASLYGLAHATLWRWVNA